MAIDTSARPHELLVLKIGDVKIKQTSDGKMYGEVEVGRGGKTKSWTVPLIVSLPYYKAWLARHPEASNPAAYVFRSLEVSAKYRHAAKTKFDACDVLAAEAQVVSFAA
ncbi:MAG: site-specific integrase [Nitrososphaera sp.]|nr:site-specific integrase [Nitrososphaera sp.]